MQRLCLTLGSALFAILLSGAASAAAIPNAPVGPIYNEQTKSFFELRTDNLFEGAAGTWGWANFRAERRNYRGLRGRLAVAPSREVIEFLRKNFDLKEEAWIGMRYFCEARKLVWVTGKHHGRTDFSNWYKRWYRDRGTKCAGRMHYMPVYVVRYGDHYYWQAGGEKTGIVSYFVEYTTSASSTPSSR